MGLIECGWATCDERGLVEKEGRSRAPAPSYLFFYQIPLVRRPLFRSTPLTESLEQAILLYNVTKHRTYYKVTKIIIMLQSCIQNEGATKCSVLGNFPYSWFSWWGRGGAKIFTVPSGGGVRFCSVTPSAWHTTELLSHFRDIVPNWLLSVSRYGFGIGTGFRERLQASCREKKINCQMHLF